MEGIGGRTAGREVKGWEETRVDGRGEEDGRGEGEGVGLEGD